LTHLSTTCLEGAEKDFETFIETFFNSSVDSEDDSKPTILFASFFEIPSSKRCENAAESQSGPVYTCCGPFTELDYDESIRQSTLLYEKMYPGDEFLPKAPEPEEIIIGDEDGTEGGVNLGALADLVDDDDIKQSEIPQESTESQETVTKNSEESE
jgi:Rab proteins geranylgeranyltransferase component A